MESEKKMLPRKMLIVAYLFPPIGGGGVQRALKMAKYLGDYGWDVSVLTVQGARHVSQDPSLLEQVPEQVKIYRAKEWKIPGMASTGTGGQATEGSSQQSEQADPLSVRLKQKLKPLLRRLKEAVLIPDEQITWYSQAVKKGETIIRDKKIDVIFSTSGPYTNHLVAKALKQKTGVPWIADFRDPWTQNMHRPQLKRRLKLEEKMEKEVIEHADILMTVTHSFAKNFRAKYGQSIKQLEVIHNGFDPQDYIHIQSSKLYPEKWIFIYTGIFYQQRNPRLFLECVAELIAEQKVNREHLSIQFAGVFDYPGYDENASCVGRLGLNDIVHVWGNLPHRNALSLLMGANQLLLIGDVTADSGDYIPGKLFEYMAVRKPIFALSVEGESARIMEKLQLGKVIPPFDKEKIKQAFKAEYDAWLNGEEKVVEPSSTLIYHRDEQAKQLAELAERLVQDKN